MSQATPEVQLCEVVDYNFSAINTTCETKTVTFEDTLPTGMVWVEDSFTSSLPVGNATITGYGTATLTVTNLPLNGGSETQYFSASAAFEMNASAGNYNNQAKFIYDRSRSTVTLQSSDRFSGNPFSTTIANASDRPIPLITSTSTDVNCFKLNGEIEVTINIENRNAFSFSDMLLFAGYDQDSFTLVEGSIQTSGISIGNNEGEFENFIIPTGNHWIKFKLKAKNNVSDFEIDAENLNPSNLVIEYEISSEITDECLAASTAKAYGIWLSLSDEGSFTQQFDSKTNEPITTATVLISGEESNNGILLSTNPLDLTNEAEGIFVLDSDHLAMVLPKVANPHLTILSPVAGTICYDIVSNSLAVFDGLVWNFWK